MTLRLVDSTAPLDFVAKNGYYRIGDAAAVHIGPACQEASRTGKQLEWVFNNQVYNNFNWRARLNLPITELYRQRAQQLRDRYDYLILWFSGGADSTTILRSFVNNGIHLDEVMIGWPRSQLSGRYTPNFSTAAGNMPSEWDFSVEPKLKWLASQYPNVKITVIDQLANPDRNEDYADTWTVTEKHGFATIDRQRLFDKEIQDRYRKYKNVANIAGCSPPEIAILDDKWLAVYFSSESASGGVGKSDYLLDGTPRNVEYFYWSEDFPEIVREQGHIILDYLNIYPNDRELFTYHKVKNSTDQRVFKSEGRRNLIKKLVYPNWDLSTFQVDKPKYMYQYVTQYQWFFEDRRNHYYLEGWHAAIKSQYSSIKKDFLEFEDGFINFPRLRSKYYPIGRLVS